MGINMTVSKESWEGSRWVIKSDWTHAGSRAARASFAAQEESSCRHTRRHTQSHISPSFTIIITR